MLTKTLIEELNEKDIESLRKARQNKLEVNHRYEGGGFMDILLAGSKKLNQEFASSDLYRLDLGDPE